MSRCATCGTKGAPKPGAPHYPARCTPCAQEASRAFEARCYELELAELAARPRRVKVTDWLTEHWVVTWASVTYGLPLLVVLLLLAF